MSKIGQRLVGAGLGWGMKAMAGRFLKEAGQANSIAATTLREILALNGGTAWGRKHGLDGADPVAAFQRLPVTTYQDYAPYIERIANGEQGVLTSEPVTYFAVTSGTTGPQKMIPVTPRQTKTIMQNMLTPMGLAMRAGLLGPVKGRWLQIMTENINGVTPGGIPKGAATSGGLQKMGKMTDLFWTSPMPVIKVQEQATARYLHLLFALGEEHLWTMVAFFPSTLLFTLRDLHARAPELLRDLADGRISPALDLSAELRADLQSRLRPNPARANQLLRLLEAGRFTLRDIWPEMGALMTAGSGTFHFYIDQLQPYLGGLPVFSPVYASSEAAIGIGLSPDRPGYVISPGSAYCEFLPVGGEERPVPMDQLEPGGTYELLLTTYAGLTRYRLGDIVRFLGYEGEAPLVDFVERKGQVINTVGEKTSEPQVNQAFMAACRELNAPVLDYLVTPDLGATPTRYLLLVEGLGGGERFEPADLLAAFERQLGEAAPDYAHYRQIEAIGPMALQLLRPGAFERYRETRVAAGASAAQVKVPHVVPDPSFRERYFQDEIIREISER